MSRLSTARDGESPTTCAQTRSAPRLSPHGWSSKAFTTRSHESDLPLAGSYGKCNVAKAFLGDNYFKFEKAIISTVVRVKAANRLALAA
jgi:hypothetical protein